MPDGGTSTPSRLTTQPGIQRDGTELDSPRYNDGLWVRFQRGKPRKMGGYRTIGSEYTGPVRGVHVFSKQSLNVIHSMSPTKIEQTTVDNNGLGSSIIDRTPAGFVTDNEYLWQFDTFFDLAGSNTSVLLAHPGKNIINIDNNIDTPVYFGTVDSETPLTALGQSVSGGVMALPPYLVLYGSNGLVKTSAANEMTNFTSGDSNEVNTSSTKIVKGFPVRGAGQSPAAILWSLDSVIRMSFIGGNQIFRFDILSTQSSVLSSNSFIEYDGLFYWIGVDRFLMFNGAIQEVPNNTNLNFFFDRLNFAQRQKVWVTKVPRFSEIWWFFPKDGATECNHAIVYNVMEKTWYDTPIFRSAGFFSQVFRFPVWADSQAEATGKYSLWQHEFGRNQIKGDIPSAIQSFFTSNDFGLPTGSTTGDAATGTDRWTRVIRVEPDFVQVGQMSVSVLTKEYATSSQVTTVTEHFEPATEKVDLRTQGRHVRIKFESNAFDGHYEMGAVILDVAPGDIRQ